MSVFSEKITPETTALPESALAVGIQSLENAYDLTTQTNSLVQRLNEAKASDPNNPEVLDAKIQVLASEGHKDFAKREAQYQKLVAESEKLLAAMREDAKQHIQPPLSEEETKAMRKQVNESKAAIETARNAASGMAQMIDAQMKTLGHEIEGGVMSLIPEVQSLKSARGGRKGATGVVYATRANDIYIDGKSIGRKGDNGKVKANFALAAEVLSERFGASEFPANKVTDTEIEEAYYSSLNLPFRDKDNAPDSHTFEFTKEVTRNGKGGEISEPVTVKIGHEKWTREGKPFAEKSE